MFATSITGPALAQNTVPFGSVSGAVRPMLHFCTIRDDKKLFRFTFHYSIDLAYLEQASYFD